MSWLLWLIRLLPLGSWAPSILPALNGAAELVGVLFQLVAKALKITYEAVELVITHPRTLLVVAAAWAYGAFAPRDEDKPAPAPQKCSCQAPATSKKPAPSSKVTIPDPRKWLGL
jgi:hypothetical protein